MLVRHGESTANVAAGKAEREGLEAIDVEARDADVRLTELGRRQAATVADALRAQLSSSSLAETRIWSSPYRRAVETARIATGAPVDLDAPHSPHDGFALDETFARNTELPESSQVYDFTEVDGSTRATFVATYASAEALQQVLDMGVVEGSTLAINQIDELLAS